MLRDPSPVSHAYTLLRDLERPTRCPSECWMRRTMIELLANVLKKAQMCGFWAAAAKRSTASWHVCLAVCVCIPLTRVKYIFGCRGQSVDHSDEQPAGQNKRDWVQQGETDSLTGELQRLNGPGKNYKKQGLNAACLGPSCLLFLCLHVQNLSKIINKHAIAMCSA